MVLIGAVCNLRHHRLFCFFNGSGKAQSQEQQDVQQVNEYRSYRAGPLVEGATEVVVGGADIQREIHAVHQYQYAGYPELLHRVFGQDADHRDQYTDHKHVQKYPEHGVVVVGGGQEWGGYFELRHLFHYASDQHGTGQEHVQNTYGQTGGFEAGEIFTKCGHSSGIE